MIEIILGIYLLLQAGDFYTTYVVLGQGGTEQNPIVRKVIDSVGVVPALVFVKSVSAAAGVVMYYAGDVGHWALALMTLVYAYVVYSNAMHIK